MNSVRRRLGWTLVIAGAAVVTTLVMGNSFLTAVIAIGVVIVLSALIPDRGQRASDIDYPNTRAPGNPYSISHVWKVDRKADLRAIAQALHANGFALAKERESPQEIVFRSGSQLRTRLFGGYFVDPKYLPIEVELRTGAEANQEDWMVQLGIHDKLGIAVRDEALEDRFALAAGRIRETVEAELSALGGVEIASASLPQ